MVPDTVMNVAEVNAVNIYRANKNYDNVSRKGFLKNLAFDLLKLAIHKGITLESIPQEIKRRGKLLLGIEEARPA